MKKGWANLRTSLKLTEGVKMITMPDEAIGTATASNAGTPAPTRMPARQIPCALWNTKEVPCTP
jgi:hypothetical protein